MKILKTRRLADFINIQIFIFILNKDTILQMLTLEVHSLFTLIVQ